MHFGIGTELEIGSNKAYVGFIYNRGLVDVLHKDFHKLTVDYNEAASRRLRIDGGLVDPQYLDRQSSKFNQSKSGFYFCR